MVCGVLLTREFRSHGRAVAGYLLRCSTAVTIVETIDDAEGLSLER